MPTTESKDELMSALTQRGASVDGNFVTCPFHEGKGRAAIYESRGQWMFSCPKCALSLDAAGVMSHKVTKPPAIAPSKRSPKPSLERLLSDTISGKRRALPLPWPKMARWTSALLPGMITLVCGQPGAGKSFLLLQGLLHLHRNGHKVAVMELEHGRAFHSLRALAIVSGEPRLLDEKWVRNNGEAAMALYQEHSEEMHRFGECIYEPHRPDVTLDEIGEWVEERCRCGVRVVVVDPVTAAAPVGDLWDCDRRFLRNTKQAAETTGASIILVTHPRKGGGGGMDSLAGGAAYPRFSQTILWLHRNNKPDPAFPVTHWVEIEKATNGKGAGRKVPLRMDDLIFEEAWQ